MKTFILTLGILIISICSLTTALKADTFTMIMYDQNNNPCYVTVTYIYEPPDGSGGPLKLFFQSCDISLPCGIAIMNNPQFWVDIQNGMTADVIIFHQSVFPPCGSGTTLLCQIGQINCVSITNNPVNGTMNVAPCSSISECYRYYSVCLNTLTFPYTLSMTYLYGTVILNQCPPWLDTSVPIPPVGKTWLDPWISGCMAPGFCY